MASKDISTKASEINTQALAKKDELVRDASRAAQTASDNTQSAAQTVSDKASSAAKTASDNTQSAAKTVSDKASSAAKTASDNTRSAGQTVWDKTSSAAQATKDSAIGAKDQSVGFLQQTGDQVMSMAQGAADAVKNTLGMNGEGKDKPSA